MARRQRQMFIRDRHSVGGYQIENSGISLFSKIDGDYFSVLGLPIIQLIDHLLNRGAIEQ